MAAPCDMCKKKASFVCSKCGLRMCQDCKERARKMGSKSHVFSKNEYMCPKCGQLRVFNWI
jgi:predicted RNA-binding Zn-ribbon protein involved in translation (DUF1610 family)